MLKAYYFFFPLFWFCAVFIFAYADTARFVFITDTQNIKVGELSDALTVQSQDAEGRSAITSETIDMEFFSNSQTGEFLNASGNAVSKVMNKGTANRTFYYRDQYAGNYELTVRGTGRTSGYKWNVSQPISVSSGLSDSGSLPNYVSHDPVASSSPLQEDAPSQSLVKPQIYVSAQAPLRAAAGADIVFEAKAFGIKKEPLLNARFVWSFGDGAYIEGKKVSHTYHLPATYVVLVEASSGELSATDRMEISVFSPQVLLSKAEAGPDGFIEIRNNGTDDLDLSRWFLRSNGLFFSFPSGTLIKRKSAVPFLNSLTKLSADGNDIALLFPSGKEAVKFSPHAEVKEVIEYKVEALPKPVVEIKKDDPEIEKESSSATTSNELVASAILSVEEGGSAKFPLLWVGGVFLLVLVSSVGYIIKSRQDLKTASEDGYKIID